MYLEHFGLNKKPFELTPDPEFLHFSKRHQLAYNHLEYGILEQTGITLITGDIGCGKTTLLRHILYKIDNSEVSIGLINNTHSSFGDLNQWIALAFNLPIENISNATLYKIIQEFIINQYSKNKRSLLIIDEAQNLNKSNLEQLRLLTNINSEKDNLFQLVLIGQPEINDILMQQSMQQLAQRITVEHHINPLNFVETKEYIHHRMKIAGAQSQVFENVSTGAIYYHSGGVPRLINTLCDCSLVYAFATNERIISLETTLEAIKGRKISGINRFNKFKVESEKIRKILQESTGKDIAVFT